MKIISNDLYNDFYTDNQCILLVFILFKSFFLLLIENVTELNALKLFNTF